MRTAGYRLQWPRGPPAKRPADFASSSWTSRLRPSRLSSKALSLVSPVSPYSPYLLPFSPSLASPFAQLVLLTLAALLLGVTLLAWRWRRDALRYRRRVHRQELVRRISKRTASELLRCLQRAPSTPPPTPRATSSWRRLVRRRGRVGCSEASLVSRSVATITSHALTEDLPRASTSEALASHPIELSRSALFDDFAEEDRPHSSPTYLGLCDVESEDDRSDCGELVPAETGSSEAEELAAGDETLTLVGKLPSKLTSASLLSTQKQSSRSHRPDTSSSNLAAGDRPCKTRQTRKLAGGFNVPNKPKLKKHPRLPFGRSLRVVITRNRFFNSQARQLTRPKSEAESSKAAPQATLPAVARHPMTPLLPMRRLSNTRPSQSQPQSSHSPPSEDMAPTDPLPPSRGLGDDGIEAPEIVPSELRGWWQRQHEFEQEACAAVSRGRLGGSVAVARHLLWQLRVLKRWRARRQRCDGEGDVSQQAEEKFLEVSMCFLLALLALLARVDRICPEDMALDVAPLAQDLGEGPSSTLDVSPSPSTCDVPT